MEDFPKRIIRAIIPNDAETTQYILTPDGRLPEKEHTYGVGRTFEGTLSQLGHFAAGVALSVDRCEDATTFGHITYLTKSVPIGTPLANGYVWSETYPE